MPRWYVRNCAMAFYAALIRSLQNINNENRPGINNAGSGNVTSTNQNTTLIFNFNASMSASGCPIEHACAVFASARSELGAEGLSLREHCAASHTTVPTEEAGRVSIGRSLDQDVAGDISLSYVRSIALPWKHKLKPVWGFITKAISQMLDHSRSVSNILTLTASAGLSLPAVQSHGIQLANTTGTFAVFALGNPYSFFKSLNVPHSIIVVDLFDKEVLIPLSEATSSAVCRSSVDSDSILLNKSRLFTVHWRAILWGKQF